MQRYNVTITAERTSTVTIPYTNPGALTANFSTPDGDVELETGRQASSDKIVVIFPDIQAKKEYSGSEYQVFVEGVMEFFGEVTIKSTGQPPSQPGQTLGTRVFVQAAAPTNPRENDLWIEVS